MVHEHNAEYLEAEAGPGAGIKLSSVHGALGGPLEVSVFQDRFPMRWEIALGLALLVLASLITAIWGARSAGVTALTSALLFGILVHRMATPNAAVGPEFGALMISALQRRVHLDHRPDRLATLRRLTPRCVRGPL